MRKASVAVALVAVAGVALPTSLHAGTDTTIVHPQADAYVWELTGTTCLGWQDHLSVQGPYGVDPTYAMKAYLRFDVTNAVPANRRFESATLWLHCYQLFGGGSPISAHEVTGAWAEMGINWPNQPAYDPVAQDTPTAVPGCGWYSWDVTAAWPGTGDLDVALVHAGGGIGGAIFRSRQYEFDSEHPYLEVAHADDSPELGTWVLLVCTAAVGAAMRRRRRK